MVDGGRCDVRLCDDAAQAVTSGLGGHGHRRTWFGGFAGRCVSCSAFSAAVEASACAVAVSAVAGSFLQLGAIVFGLCPSTVPAFPGVR
jgi:hypothetical protein